MPAVRIDYVEFAVAGTARSKAAPAPGGPPVVLYSEDLEAAGRRPAPPAPSAHRMAM